MCLECHVKRGRSLGPQGPLTFKGGVEQGGVAKKTEVEEPALEAKRENVDEATRHW